MRTEELLAAILTGLWRWDHAVGAVELNAEAARLLGLPAEPVAVAEGVVRSRVHPVDWNEFGAVASLALAEDTLAEARLRVMDEKGQVVRTVRSRAKPTSDETGLRFVGTLQQVAEPDPGVPRTRR